MRIETKHVTPIEIAVEWGRLPFNSKGDAMGPRDKELARKLARCASGSGHDSMLKGIVVLAEFTATHDFILQLYRYHFRDTVSSESKMHCITKGSIKDKCSRWVDNGIIEFVDDLIKLYNTSEPSGYNNFWMSYGVCCDVPRTKKQLFECIIHNTPLGYELTFGEVTNYLQLKTMYAQRKNHKMSGWSELFEQWVKTLPYSHLITGEVENE